MVRRDGAALERAELDRFLNGRLIAHKRPRRIIFVDEIPKGPTGKPQRHKLAEALCGNSARQMASSSDRSRRATALERELQNLWAKALGHDRVGLQDDFFALGGDFLQAVELFLSIERTLGQPLPRSILFEASTVSEMARRIEASSFNRCIVPIQPDGKRPPIYCVHDVNGEVLNFRALAHHLGHNQPLYALQSVGLDGQEPPLARIEEMATRYISEIRRLQSTGPYYLAGYSMGSLIAYEMAQQLRQGGQNVGMLVLFDTQPRHGHMQFALLRWFEQDGNHLPDLRLSSVAHYLGRGFRNIVQTARTALWRRLFGIAWRFL